jgi:hypothetical protein
MKFLQKKGKFGRDWPVAENLRQMVWFVTVCETCYILTEIIAEQALEPEPKDHLTSTIVDEVSNLHG